MDWAAIADSPRGFRTSYCDGKNRAGFAQGRLKQLHSGYKLLEAMLGRIKPLSCNWFQVGRGRPSPGAACIPFRGYKNPLHFRLKRPSSLLAMVRTNKIPFLVIHFRQAEGFISLNSPLVEIAVILQAVKPDAVAMRQGVPPIYSNDCLFSYSVRNRTVARRSKIVNICVFRF
jgi:hypothetical protein